MPAPGGRPQHQHPRPPGQRGADRGTRSPVERPSAWHARALKVCQIAGTWRANQAPPPGRSRAPGHNASTKRVPQHQRRAGRGQPGHRLTCPSGGGVPVVHGLPPWPAAPTPASQRPRREGVRLWPVPGQIEAQHTSRARGACLLALASAPGVPVHGDGQRLQHQLRGPPGHHASAPGVKACHCGQHLQRQRLASGPSTSAGPDRGQPGRHTRRARAVKVWAWCMGLATSASAPGVPVW